jgi:hypothetical protein
MSVQRAYRVGALLRSCIWSEAAIVVVVGSLELCSRASSIVDESGNQITSLGRWQLKNLLSHLGYIFQCHDTGPALRYEKRGKLN